MLSVPVIAFAQKKKKDRSQQERRQDRGATQVKVVDNDKPGRRMPVKTFTIICMLLATALVLSRGHPWLRTRARRRLLNSPASRKQRWQRRGAPLAKTLGQGARRSGISEITKAGLASVVNAENLSRRERRPLPDDGASFGLRLAGSNTATRCSS
jgi:hypothetical protein